VDDEFELEPLLEETGWLTIPTADGGAFAVPQRLVVAVALAAPEDG